MSFPFSSTVVCLSLVLFLFSFWEPITFQFSLFTSDTRHELCVHSPLIRCQSYLSAGTIVTEGTQLRAAACRKNGSAPTSLWDSASNSIIQAACHCHTLSHSHCVLKKDASSFISDCHPNGVYRCGSSEGKGKCLFVSVFAISVSQCWSTAFLLFARCRAAFRWLPFLSFVPIHLLLNELSPQSWGAEIAAVLLKRSMHECSGQMVD